MKRVQLGITRLSAGLLAVVLCLGGAGRARAEFIFTFAQVGPNVTVTGMGTIDTAGLNNFGSEAPPLPAQVSPDVGIVAAGPLLLTDMVTTFSGLTGPANFGPGSATVADSSSGNDVVVAGFAPEILLPSGYVSGDPLSDSATFNNTTISGLGLTPGTYIYTLPNDTLEVIVPSASVAAVPEPSTLSILAVGLGLAGWSRRRRAG